MSIQGIVDMKLQRITLRAIAAHFGVGIKTVRKHWKRWQRDHSYTF